MPAPSARPEPLLSRLARLVVLRRRSVLLAWVAILTLALVGGPSIAGEWSVNYDTPGSESTLANDVMKREFPAVGADSLLITWTNARGADTRGAQQRVAHVVREADALPGVLTGDLRHARFSRDRTIGLLEVPLSDRPANIAAHHGERVMEIADSASSEAVTVRLSGLLMQESQRGEISSESVGLSVALLILLVTFGSVVAAGLPIATALFGVGTAAAIVGGIAALVPTPDWASSVATMVGIGVGIDYALLILTRHRAALRGGASVDDAIAHSLATAGRSVLIAGGTVVISLLGLLLMGLPYLQGVALSASAAATVVLIASLTLLPALLGFAGRRIDALAIRRPGRRRREQGLAGADAADGSAGFARWSRWVQRHPWVGTLVGLAVIAVIAAPLTGVRLGFPGMDSDPAGSQTREATALMTKGFGEGVTGPLQIVAPIRKAGDTAKLRSLGAQLAKDGRVAAVMPLQRSASGRTGLLIAQPRMAPETAEADALLATVRDELVPASGADAKVTGWTARTHDQSQAIASRLPLLIVGVAGLSALLLLAAFRSVLIPLKAAVMNLLSILAAYGVVAAIAEGGALGRLVGIDADVPIPPFIPVLMFAVLFGLSMDYEVFLLGRIRELWLEHGDPARAVTDGLAATARVITAAAAIMIAVFGAFGFSDVLFLKLVGIGMATAIFVDATIIRLLLVPAVMQLMGRSAWWMPRWLDRLVPEAKLEAGSDAVAPARGR